MVDLHLHGECSAAAKDTFLLRHLARGKAGLRTSSSISDKGPLGLMVETAAGLGLRAVSFTDHWTVAGLPAARAKTAEHGIECVPGIEIASLLETGGAEYEVHLLGYWFAPGDPGIRRLCRDALETCVLGARAFLEGLAMMGIELAEGEVERDRDGHLSGWAIRRVLVSRGHAPDKWAATDLQRRAVARALASGSRYAPLRRGGVLRAAEIIEILRRAGASVFMAHPFWLTRYPAGGITEETAWRHIELMLENGVHGLEACYPGPPGQAEKLLRYCRRHRIPACGGSDSHNAPGLERSVLVPGTVFESMLRHRRGENPW